MDVQTRKTFLLWSKRPEYREKVTATRIQLYELTRKYKCVVAYSGGKDSTVLLDLALKTQPDISVYHWDHGSQLMPREIEKEVIENAYKLGAKNLVVNSSLAVERGDMRENWKGWYGIFWASLAKKVREYGWEIQLVGLRADESCKRRAKVSNPTKGEVYPLADWGWRDVWAYIVSNNLPYPRMYDVYGPLLGYDRARFVTFFDGEFEKFGSPYLDGFFFPQYRNQKQPIN